MRRPLLSPYHRCQLRYYRPLYIVVPKDRYLRWGHQRFYGPTVEASDRCRYLGRQDSNLRNASIKTRCLNPLATTYLFELYLRYFGFAYTWLPPKSTPLQSSKGIRTSKTGYHRYLRHPLWGQSYRVIGEAQISMRLYNGYLVRLHSEFKL